MRRRLLIVSMTLVSVLLIALTAPLVNAYAADRTQDLFLKRLVDVSRFAVLAEDALEAGRFAGLTADLERYAEVYGGAVVVTDANQKVVAASNTHVDLDSPEVSAAIDEALSGSGSESPGTVWPWVDKPFVIGSPIGRDAQIFGAVVMISPTDSVRGSVSGWLLCLVVAGLATLGLTAAGVVSPFVGWITRPVHDLDQAAKRWARGDLTSRVPSLTGPPELRDLVRSFNHMAASVETSQLQQRELIADAAHQLGNPLTALQLRVENLGGPPYEPGELDKVLEETGRLNSIVESLLDLSQVGAHGVRTGCVEVVAKVRHRCGMWAPLFTRLTVEAPATALALASDDIVDVVLDALLDNAVKFAEGSPVDVTVIQEERKEREEQGEKEESGHILLRVRDYGPGLDAEDIEKVGARFFRGRRHQNIAGTGLGMAIVRARVLDLGGEFAVAPACGGGLQVEVRLPRFTPAARENSAELPGADRVGT